MILAKRLLLLLLRYLFVGFNIKQVIPVRVERYFKILKLLFLLKGKAQFLLSISIFFGCYEHLQAYDLFLKVIEAVNSIDFWPF